MSYDDFDGFDEIDRALGDGLRGLAPRVHDTADEALETLRPRLRRARTRAHVVRAGAVVVAFFAISSAVALAAPQRRAGQVRVAASMTSVDETTRPAPHHTTTTRLSPTTNVVVATVPDSGRAPAPAVHVPGSPTAVPPAHHGASATTVTDAVPSGTAPTTITISTTSTTKPPNGELHTYASPGGRVAMRFANGALRLVSYSAEPGYRADVNTNEATDVEVRFDNNDRSYRIRVRVQDGRLVVGQSQN